MARVSRDSEAAHFQLSFPSFSTRTRRDRRAFASAARRASFGGICLRNGRGTKARFSSFKPCFERAGPRTTASPCEESNRNEPEAAGKSGRSPTRRRGRASAGRGWREGKHRGRMRRRGGWKATGAEEANGHPRSGRAVVGSSVSDGSVFETDRPTFGYSDFLTDIPLVSLRLVPSQFDVVLFFSVHSIVRITTTSSL